MTRTREEHLAWCRERAVAEFEYYLIEDGFDKAKRNACLSMVSDLRKHPETQNAAAAALTLMWEPMTCRRDVENFLEGFQ